MRTSCLRAYTALINHNGQKYLELTSSYTFRSLFITEGIQGRNLQELKQDKTLEEELKQRPWRDAIYWLVLLGFLKLPTENWAL